MSEPHLPEASEQQQVMRALVAEDESVRLRAAMQAGTHPDPTYVDTLIERNGVEPDFFVRDMITWALINHDHDQVIDRLLPELYSLNEQARAQAMHTISKLGETRLWPAITDDLLTDPGDWVARTAWRAAAALVPAGQEADLAERMSSQWGRGDREVQLSFSQAMISLGEAALPEIERAMAAEDEATRVHARATRRLIENPKLAFDSAVEQAKPTDALNGAPDPE